MKIDLLISLILLTLISGLDFEFQLHTGVENCAHSSGLAKQLAGRSVLECGLECQSKLTCKAFSFFRYNFTCHYFSSYPTLFATDPKCNTYLKLCEIKIDGLDPASQCAIPYTYQGMLFEKCIYMDEDKCDLECFDWNWIQQTCQTPNSFLATYSTITRPDLATFPLLTINDWVVIQHRPNMEDFKRSFDEYEAGFTSTGDSYWVGLSSLHTITNTGNYRLRFEVQSLADDTWYSAEYQNFVVDSAVTQYVFHAKNYVGDAGDAVYYKAPVETKFTIDGAKFYTYDKVKEGCEYLITTGGFWFQTCNAISLNSDAPLNYWFILPNGEYQVKASKMMIKLVSV